ncbi:hypothetical protein DLB95_24275 [Salmonella enterica subsp. diarizonae]|uniref:Uncharacterized protein n=1 Tax=Salmonella diarizonae TaxID=59204 RepID=A0A5Y3W7N7_SALDZ|nr:hypothetical protein [Salmonella enterica subsp. diarizonae]ECJ4380243.1 hypothetical protein [Salmonella enterica subsp. diarizonae]ECO1612296.1 hypothetical protein [Salmonella enterica subsp. enterica serovar Paratyphi B]
MSTVSYTLDPDSPWKQITSGTEVQPVLVQVISGGLLFCESATLPATNAAAHHMPAGPNAFISVTAPDVIWVKGSKELSDSVIVVTGSDIV